MTLRRHSPAAALLALGLVAAPLAAQQPAQQAAAAPPASLMGTRGVLHTDLSGVEGKYNKLAEALAAKYDYRPAAGVRSTGEVLAHVAAANFMIANSWGAPAPAGVDPMAVSKLTDAAQIQDALKKSFAHLHGALNAVPEAELDKGVKLFGRDLTVRAAQMLLLNHMHEHLGQLIAYSRASGVVPPWSTGG